MIDKLKELIPNYVEVDESAVTDGARFAEDLGFNSYDFMCMLGDIEDELDIEIEENEAFKNKTVGELAGYLEGLKNG
ncbi:MAG: acyl carrier protein [Ruminococcus sp.]|nr:acyl carrier protein [Ruminococcus sp.]